MRPNIPFKARCRRLPGTLQGLATLLMWVGLVHSTLGQSMTFSRERSDPPGIVSEATTARVLGISVVGNSAPPESNGYRFTHWTLNGIRLEDQLGRAINPPRFIILGESDCVAHYLSGTRDSDSDGVPDWYEIQFYGTLTNGPASDTDGDGFTLKEEWDREMQPLVMDSLQDGGISRRRSQSFWLMLSTNYVVVHQSSVPPGIVDSSEALAVGTLKNLPDVSGLVGGYKFGGWYLNGVRLSDAAGRSCAGLSFTVAEQSEVIAYFYPETEDANSDGVPDWFARQFYGTIGIPADSDTDADGITLREEFDRGLHPNVADTLQDGGISRRRSGLFALVPAGFASFDVSSVPPGIVAQTTYSAVGNLLQTPTAPDNFNGYIFGYWLVNGQRQADGVGYGINPAGFTIASNTVAVACYYPGTDDSDSDGVPDWFEYRYSGTLALAGTTDSDGDGFTLAAEFTRGTHPNIADSLQDGGISRRRGESFYVSVESYYPLTVWTKGGGGVTAGGGAIEPATYYPVGNVLGLGAFPANGWQFLRWQGTETGVANPFDVGMYRTQNVEAVFGTVVTTNVTGSGAVVMSAGNPVPFGTDLGVEAVPHRGHYFVGWSGALTGTNPSAVLTVNVAEPGIGAAFATIPSPTILRQPVDLSAFPGESATFSVDAIGNPQPGYQWRKNGVLIADATASGFSITGVNTNDAASYDVVVANNQGSVTSAVVTLTVTVPAFIAGQPCDLFLRQGSQADFTVSAGGSDPLSYQWRKDGSLLPGQNGTALTLNSIRTNDAGGYEVVVSNRYGVATSRVARLSVNEPEFGSSYQSTVLSQGPVGYWRLNEQVQVPPVQPIATNLGSLGSRGDGQYATGSLSGGVGARSPAYAGMESDNHGVWLDGIGGGVVLPGLGFRTNGVTICGWVKAGGQQVTGAGLVLGRSGERVSGLTMDPLHGGLGVGYSWGNDSGATNWSPTTDGGLPLLHDSEWTYVALVVEPARASIYLCDRGNFGGFAGVTNVMVHGVQGFDGAAMIGSDPTSGSRNFRGMMDEVAVFDRALGVGEIFTQIGAAVGGVPARIFNQPRLPERVVYVSDPVRFDVDAGGSPGLAYQWRKDGMGIAGATSSVYAKSNLQLADSGAYDCVISNAYGTVTSEAAALGVKIPLLISEQPGNLVVVQGNPAVFGVATEGSQPMRYQWRRDGVMIAGATMSTLALSGASTNDVGGYDIVVENSYMVVTSMVATLVVKVPPYITMQPERTSVMLGGTAGFSISAGGTQPLSCQWYRDGISLAGGTGLSLTLSNVSTNAEGNYSVVVTNAWGTTTSVPAFLTVNVPPFIALQPTETSVAEGYGVTMSVVAGGSGTLLYQWRKDGVSINRGTNSSFVIGQAAVADSGSYDVVVWSVYGTVTSVPAVLTVRPSTWVEVQNAVGTPRGTVTVPIKMVGRDVENGVSFSLNYDPAVLYYQSIQLGSAAAGGFLLVNNGSTNVGRIGIGLALPSGTTVSSGPQEVFRVTFRAAAHTNEAGTVVSFGDAPVVRDLVDELGSELDVAWVNGAVHFQPAVLVQPVSQVVTQRGGGLRFDVGVSGSYPLSCQWWKDGVALAWQTNVTLSITPAGLADAGNYSAVVTNLYGSTTSVVAVAGIHFTPLISSEPQSLAVMQGGIATFAVAAGGSQPLGYQWRKGGALIVGATTTSITFGTVSTNDVAAYDVVVSNDYGSVTSAVATLTVNVPPYITAQPQGTHVLASSFASFTVAAGGTQPLQCQWRKDGTVMAGKTGFTLAFGSVTTNDNGGYDAVVTNAYGSVTSVVANLVVPWAKLSLGASTQMAGITFSVPVNIDAVGNENAMGFSLTYDPARLQFVSAAISSNLTGASVLLNTSSTNSGKVGFGISVPMGTTLQTGTQEVMRVVFTPTVSLLKQSTTINFGDVPVIRQLADLRALEQPASYAGAVLNLVPTEYEGDVMPRGKVDGTVRLGDWVQVGRFVAALDLATNIGEFQRADCAPRSTQGDGRLTVTDWVQAGRYAVSLDPAMLIGGPSSPTVGPSKKYLQPVSAGRVLRFVSQNALPGKTVRVQVQLEGQGDENALGFSVRYDTSRLTLKNVNLGAGASGAVVNVNTNAVGRVGMAILLEGEGTFGVGQQEVALLEFATITGVDGTSPLVFEEVPVAREASNSEAESLAATFENGAITVVPEVPTLDISNSGRGIKLSWPMTQSGYVLERSSRVASGGWSDVKGERSTNARNIYVTIPLENAPAFFRLRKE